MNESNEGYWQIVDVSGVVVRQRAASGLSERYIREKVWDVPSQSHVTLKHSETTDYIEPWKFFKAHKKGTQVTLYNELVGKDVHGQIVSGELSIDDLMTQYKEFDLIVVDVDIEALDEYIFDNKGFQTWEAYIGSEWVGTSEF